MIELGDNQQLTPYPGGPYDVRPAGSVAPGDLPAGFGAVAVHTSGTQLEGTFTPPIVGVDGKPAVHGYGSAVIVLPAGDRLLEVQQGKPRQATLVRVSAGQIAEFDYSSGGKQAQRKSGQSRDGLLDGVDQKLQPFVAWGALVFALIALIATLFSVVVMLVTGQIVVALFVLVVGGLISVGLFYNWKVRRRSGGR